jgi:hypothetical protein
MRSKGARFFEVVGEVQKKGVKNKKNAGFGN